VRRLLPLAAAAALAACAALQGRSGPPPHPLPGEIRKLSIRPIVNKTQQSGLEDLFVLAVRDEFLRDGRYPPVPENESDGVILITITRYLLTPLQYDSNQNPTTYKLRIAVDVQLLDRAANKALWDEKGLEASLAYPNSSLAGGLGEAQARADLWPILAPMIVARVIDGYGATESEPEKKSAAHAPRAPH
jgi:hypothetical protein